MSENSEKKLELPSLELLEAELAKEQYKDRYGKVLRSTIFFLVVVAAATVLIAVLLLPVPALHLHSFLYHPHIRSDTDQAP